MDASDSSNQTAADPGTAKDGAIRPFSIEVPQEDLDELRRRITATRWPSKELVDDRSQGVQLATACPRAEHHKSTSSMSDGVPLRHLCDSAQWASQRADSHTAEDFGWRRCAHRGEGSWTWMSRLSQRWVRRWVPGVGA